MVVMCESPRTRHSLTRTPPPKQNTWKSSFNLLLENAHERYAVYRDNDNLAECSFVICRFWGLKSMIALPEISRCVSRSRQNYGSTCHAEHDVSRRTTEPHVTFSLSSPSLQTPPPGRFAPSQKYRWASLLNIFHVRWRGFGAALLVRLVEALLRNASLAECGSGGGMTQGAGANCGGGGAGLERQAKFVGLWVEHLLSRRWHLRGGDVRLRTSQNGPRQRVYLCLRDILRFCLVPLPFRECSCIPPRTAHLYSWHRDAPHCCAVEFIRIGVCGLRFTALGRRAIGLY